MSYVTLYWVSDVIERNETRSFGWAFYERHFANSDSEYAYVIAECGDSSEGNAEQLARVTGQRQRLEIGRVVETGQGQPQSRVFLDALATVTERRRFYPGTDDPYIRLDPHKGWRPRFDETPPEVREKLLSGELHRTEVTT